MAGRWIQEQESQGQGLSQMDRVRAHALAGVAEFDRVAEADESSCQGAGIGRALRGVAKIQEPNRNRSEGAFSSRSKRPPRKSEEVRQAAAMSRV